MLQFKSECFPRNFRLRMRQISWLAHAHYIVFWPTWKFFYLPDIGSESGVKSGSNQPQFEVPHSLTHFRSPPDVGSASDRPQYEDTLTLHIG